MTDTLSEDSDAIRRRVRGDMTQYMRGVDFEPRQKVALACRILAAEGHAQTLAGQVTVRAADETWWTTDFASGLRDACASTLVRFDREMQVVEGVGMPNPAVRFHLWIYAQRPDVNAIVHTHPPHVSALSMLGEPLQIAHMDAMMLHGNCAYLPDWPGVPISNEEGRIICGALGDKPAVLLAHHGLLTACDSIERATYLGVMLEHAARLQLLAQSAGKIRAVPPELAGEARDFLSQPSIVEATFAYWARRILREQPDAVDGSSWHGDAGERDMPADL
jgi:L-fuculose-phosphate aldolase